MQLPVYRETQDADLLLEKICACQVSDTVSKNEVELLIYPYIYYVADVMTPHHEFGWSVVRRADLAEHDRGVTFCRHPFTNLMKVYYHTDPQYRAADPFYVEKAIELKSYPLDSLDTALTDIMKFLYREWIV